MKINWDVREKRQNGALAWEIKEEFIMANIILKVIKVFGMKSTWALNLWHKKCCLSRNRFLQDYKAFSEVKTKSFILKTFKWEIVDIGEMLSVKLFKKAFLKKHILIESIYPKSFFPSCWDSHGKFFES